MALFISMNIYLVTPYTQLIYYFGLKRSEPLGCNEIIWGNMNSHESRIITTLMKLKAQTLRAATVANFN